MLSVFAAALALLPALSAGQRTPDTSSPLLPVTKTTAHLSFTARLSSAVAVPGKRISVRLDITPKPGMHVYAPNTDYQAITVSLASEPPAKVHDTVYPKPTPYLFAPLDETVLVYSAPFRLVRDITPARMAPGSRLRLTASVEYQACDDSVCYVPVSVPLAWTLGVGR